MADTFFTSDTHFGHKNIITYCKRPFASTAEMDETMIKNWNAVVKPQDTIYHVGDVAFGEGVIVSYVSGVLNRLNGSIHLVEGNHEELAKQCSERFSSIKQYDEIKIGKQRIVLFHYGLRTWHHDLRGVWHLYGHSHGELPAYGKSCDIGVDCWNFRPVEFEELKKYMDARPIGDHPQFANFVPRSEL
jgi:calcineurin-like phosphoesterase family protein